LSSIRQDKYFSEKFETAVNLQLSDYFRWSGYLKIEVVHVDELLKIFIISKLNKIIN